MKAIERKRITTISELTRSRLDITRDEYAFISYTHYRSADPRQRVAGWCTDPKEEIAEFVGISRPGLYKMIDRMSQKGLIEVDAISGFLRATAEWIDAENKPSSVNKVYKNRQIQDSNGVNLVDTDCKLSLQSGVNLVTPIYKVKEDIKVDKGEGETATPPPPKNEPSSLIAKNPPSPQVPAAPPSPGVDIELTPTARPYPKTAFELQERLRAYFVANPNEWTVNVLEAARATKWKDERIKNAVLKFCLHQEKNSDMGRTFNEYRAGLTRWFLDEPTFSRNEAADRKEYGSKESDSVLPLAIRKAL